MFSYLLKNNMTASTSNSPTIKNGRFCLNLDKLSVFLGFFLLTPCVAAPPSPVPTPVETEKYPLDTAIPGPSGPYSKWLIHSLKNWPTASVHFLTDAAHPPTASSNPVEIICLAKPGELNAIGAGQRMRIEAPLAAVEAVVDAIDQYQSLFPGYKQVRVESRNGNRWLTFWEQIVPIFFVPNVKYEMDYLLSKPSPTRKIYRYQLHQKNTLKYSDGAIVLEALGPSATQYTEFDFFDADWGIAASFGGDRIWSDSIESLYLSDLGIKLKAENPSWSEKKAAETAKTYLKRYEIRDMVKLKTPFPPEDPVP